jgi:hypothetical protein
VRNYLIYGGIIALAGIVINFSLGGFKSIEPELVSTKGVTIYGALYEGEHSSDLLSNQISYYRNLVDDSDQEGILTIINYIQPDLEKRGIIRQFIGIEWLNVGYENEGLMDSLIIEPYNGIQFRMKVTPLVMPSPEKLKQQAAEAAELMDSELLGHSIEQYMDGFLIINFPMK